MKLLNMAEAVVEAHLIEVHEEGLPCIVASLVDILTPRVLASG